MINRPARGRRRLTAWLVAALLGVGGALTGVTPASAASTCNVTFRVNYWPTIDGQPRWQVDTTITNTGTAPALTWLTLLYFPYSSGATVPQYWNTTKRDRSGRIWGPVEWNRGIQPGGGVTFGFEVRTPTADISPLPTSWKCSVTY